MEATWIAGGEVRVERKSFWSKACGGVCPADELSGIAQASISPGPRSCVV